MPRISLLLIVFFLFGCNAQIPNLKPIEASTQNTIYLDAIRDLNTMLEVYLPPEYPTKYYHVKTIKDSTGISKTTEIPPDITPHVRDAISQVTHKVRHVELYDNEDATHLKVERELQATQRLRLGIIQGQRYTPDFTVTGSISLFDRNLTSTSNNASGRGSFGGGTGQVDTSASFQNSASTSRLGVSFSVYDRNGVSCPGRFGATAEVAFAKNGVDIGFAIHGIGIGFATEATAMHGRHHALQMLAELSVIQIIGRTMTIPYWRIGSAQKVFSEDGIVTNAMQYEYATIVNSGMIIPFIQAQCIANGDSSVAVTGVVDQPTRNSIAKFAVKYGVKNSSFPSFEMYKALELNRVLDRNIATRAWSAYNAYKGGARPSSPAASAPTSRPSPSASPAAAPARKPKAAPARPAAPAPDVTSPLEDLI